MNIYDQLQAVEDRYEELGELLSDPDVVSDTKRFMELSKEESATRDTVTAYREYKTVLQNIVDAEEMIKESSGDADLEEMAKKNLNKLRLIKRLTKKSSKFFFYQKTLTMTKISSWKSVVPQVVMKLPSLLETF